MDNERQFATYEAETMRVAKQLDEVSQQIFEWIKAHRDAMPSITEIGRLEAFHAQRARFVAELLVVEQRFMERLIASLKA